MLQIQFLVDKLNDALEQSAEDFKAEYGRNKPTHDELILFMCQRGVRSKKAMEEATKLGYNKYVHFDGFSMYRSYHPGRSEANTWPPPLHLLALCTHFRLRPNPQYI